MGEVEEIEKRIESLPPEDLIELRRWFLEFDARLRDQQIEAGSNAGNREGLVAGESERMTPNVRALRGLMRGASVDERDYRRALEEKYLNLRTPKSE